VTALFRPREKPPTPQGDTTPRHERWLPPALRTNNQEDDLDSKRATWAEERWTEQDAIYRLRDRSIEEHIRMIAGQQWWVYHHLLGWQDIFHWMTDDEKRWRQRPVFNRILPWFILTHARFTENPFICTFLPGPDQHDAEVAEMLDTLYKIKWRDTGMVDVWARCASWIIASGTGFQQSRIDLSKGEFEDWVGKAELALLGPDGQPVLREDGQPITREIPEGVPFDAKGQPLAELTSEGLRITGKPHRERRGDLVMDVHSPLEVRGQWGPRPWHEQKIHLIRSYIPPSEVYERWGVEVEPDVTDLPSGSAGFLERMLFGSGFYGAASSPVHPYATGSAQASPDGYCCIQSTWMAPSKAVEGMEETEESTGGRLLVTAKGKTLFDGPRPFKCKWTSPVRCYEFIRLPGRPWGSTPLEMLVSPQKAYNQGWKQVLENRALCANPQQVYDLDSGLRSNQVDNRPGRQYGVRMKKGVKPIDWIIPPAMGSDVWRSQLALSQELSYIGSQTGTDAQQTMSRRSSAKMMEELRFNDDRFIGPTMMRCAEENGRMIEDWRAMARVLYTTETLLKYTGEDSAARAVVLMPQLLDTADVTVQPDIESMKPEGRGERRQRVYQMWKDSAFGDPKSPQARRILYEVGRFPSMAQMVPGGVHLAAAKQENAKMVQGQACQVEEWQDHEVHLDAHETFMAAPEFTRLPDAVRAIFIEHRRQTMEGLVRKQRQMQLMAQAAQAPPMPLPGAPAPGALPAGAPAQPAGAAA
jgi:hypothetical protein